jgi:hypothetical protein
MALEIIGIRHYSPACARLVAARIAALRPHTVLIEGPSDFNDRLEQLALPHRLPLAIFSYHGNQHHTASCHAPLVEFAPEWAALNAARALAARVRFMDLPYWHAGARELPQRYTLRTLPGRERYGRVSAELQQQTGIEGEDALWDHLFEQDADRIGVDAAATESLQRQLEYYFDQLRADEVGHPGDQAREAHMRDWIRWAQSTPGPVLVVCGGWHRRALLPDAPGHVERSADTACLLPAEPTLTPPPELTRHGSYLVPYSDAQLDAYAGYGAGMPSPLWYRWQWQQGTEFAGRHTLMTIVKTLRAARQPLATAQLVQSRARILGLARLRGHPLPLRSDVLDGLLDALCDSALEEPPPWTRRSPPGRATDARLRAALRALAGDARGALAPGTPQPPLVDEVDALLATHDLLAPTGPRRVELDRRRADDAVRAEILWRLRTLGIAGYVLIGTAASGAARGLSSDQHYQERWTLSTPDVQRLQLIEAGAWGATLAEAATHKLRAAAAAGAAPIDLVDSVVAALRCGFLDLGTQLAQDAAQVLASAHEWSALTGAAMRLSTLLDSGFWGSDLAPLLEPMLQLLEARLSWLIESRLGANAPADPADIEAVRFLAWCHARAAPGADTLLELLQRRALDPQAAPTLRGAAAGALWQAAQAGCAPFDESAVIAAARRLATPAVLGDWLIGLFALARELVVRAPQLVMALDSLFEAHSDAEFLAALPALRQAFAWFPPRERAAIAEQVAALHGQGSALAMALMTLPDDVASAARGAAVQVRARELMTRFGLGRST